MTSPYLMRPLRSETEVALLAALAALEIIAGMRQPADNLLSNEDIARAAIDKARGKED